ncbi:O-antigen polymerase [uncultured Sphaerochaeta sp.]|uniref:O-antigen polymerase n=1 Tax=uncultured Sphaerochaeta sp. TaxID=886478 RepID=UPI002A0A7499|nr:O-antigen polymerase [uncultured Sphaerochaeta sp.]
MQFILPYLLFGIVLFTYHENKDFFNPIVILFSIWGVIVFLSSLRLYGMYVTSQRTYYIITLGLFCFYFGYLVSMKLKIDNFNELSSTNITIQRECSINYTFVYIFCIITVILLFQDLRIIIFQRVRIGEIRNFASTPTSALYSSRGRINGILRILVVNPFLYVILPIFGLTYWKEKRYMILQVLTFLVIILQFFTLGGRLFFVLFVFHFLLIRSVYIPRKKFIITRESIQFFLLIVLAIGLFLVIARLRGNQDLLKTLYIYISGCVPHLDVRIKIIDYDNIYTMGLASLSGLFSVIFQFLDTMNILEKPFFWVLTQSKLFVENAVSIGSTTKINAFVTPFFYLYLDFRVFGVIFGMGVYGFLTGRLYRLMRTSKNYVNVFLYSLILQGLMLSMIRLEFANSAYVISLFYSLILFKKQSRKITIRV